MLCEENAWLKIQAHRLKIMGIQYHWLILCEENAWLKKQAVSIGSPPHNSNRFPSQRESQHMEAKL